MVWQFTEALQGNAYTFEQFKKSIMQQQTVKAWLNAKGAESLKIDNQVLDKKTYFNYQSQKLWSVVNSLNYFVNPVSRKIIPKWEGDAEAVSYTHLTLPTICSV